MMYFYPQIPCSDNATLCSSKNPTIKVNGIGNIKAEPNLALINLGVITEDKDLEKAQQENAVKSNAVLNQLYAMNIPKNQISTASYTIEPQYNYVEGKQIFRGYKVSNILNVKTKELNKVGEIVDNAVKAGANVVNSITFTIDNNVLYYNKALSLAVKDAIAKAINIGNTIGVKIHEVPFNIIELTTRSINEEPPTGKVYAASATPIIPGEINVTARIEATFNYC